MHDEERSAISGGEPDLAACPHANLRRATRVVSKVYDDALRSSGLRATQYTLLAVLARDGGMPLTRLAQVLLMDRTTLTRNLAPLLAKGWLRTGTGDDQRVRMVSVTGAGLDTLALATPLWRAARADVSRGLGSVRLSRLIKELNSMIEALRLS